MTRDEETRPSPVRAIELFYAYSHRDEILRDELEKHLRGLSRSGVISGWHDRRISGGIEWDGRIDEHLNRSDIILLLVSADFIASDYCYDREMRRALELHELGEARVIPVILRPCDWQGTPFAKLQALPRDAIPVTKWENQDEALRDVAVGIRSVAEELRCLPQRPKERIEPSWTPTSRGRPAEPPTKKVEIGATARRLRWRPSPSTLLQVGPVIDILISTTRPEMEAGKSIGLQYQELLVKALIDTGAALTIINPQIAATCKLLQTDWSMINSVGGQAGEYPAHAAAISFPGTALPSFDVIRVVACPIIKQPFFSCLIGRDILRKWLLVYDGPNGELEITA
jgi:TIR domain/Retroviral aspartyl protease